MPATLHCWLLYRAIKHVVRRALKKRHHPARHVARIAASKPAIVGYVCVAVTGGGQWLVTPEIESPPRFQEIATPIPWVIDTSFVDGGAPLSSALFDQFPFPPPQILPGGGPSVYGVTAIAPAERPWAVTPSAATGTPVPEPSTAALLLPALAVVAMWGRR